MIALLLKRKRVKTVLFFVCCAVLLCCNVHNLTLIHHVGSSGEEIELNLFTTTPMKVDTAAHVANATSTAASEFYHATTNPTPAYTEEMAKDAIRSSNWNCSGHYITNNNNGTIFDFVHIYKAAGTTMRAFFKNLAVVCDRTYIALARCTGVIPSSLKSEGPWNPCMITEVADGRSQRYEQYLYPKQKAFVRPPRKASNAELRHFVDIISGHARIGTGDYIFPSGGIRHIVFLRDTIERYVSGVMYQNKMKNRQESLDEVVGKIKKNIKHARHPDVNRYYGKTMDYLLTPSQHQRVANDFVDYAQLKSLLSSSNNTTITSTKTTNSFKAEVKAKLVIHNLHKYNAIMGMTEEMSHSMQILRRVFLPRDSPDREAEELFYKFGLTSEEGGKEAGNSSTSTSNITVGIQVNKSSRKDVSTSTVIAKLKEDEPFMILFNEFVKYDQIVLDYARTMHSLQYKVVVKQ